MDLTLLKTQKNEVLDVIRSEGLDPFNFEWTTRRFRHPGHSTSSYEVPCLIYKGTDFFFVFDKTHTEGYEAIFSPGRESHREDVSAGSWGNEVYHFACWIQNLKREIDAPDMWARLSEYSLAESSGDLRSIENQQFTASEVGQIADGLKRMRKYLESEFDFNEQQLEAVDEKLEYLLDAAQRQGKKDWLHTAIGAVFTLSVSLALAPAQASRIWTLLKEAVGGIVKLLQ